MTDDRAERAALTEATDAELREECLRRGYELHSLKFSGAAQEAIRLLADYRKRIDAALLRAGTPEGET